MKRTIRFLAVLPLMIFLTQCKGGNMGNIQDFRNLEAVEDPSVPPPAIGIGGQETQEPQDQQAAQAVVQDAPQTVAQTFPQGESPAQPSVESTISGTLLKSVADAPAKIEKASVEAVFSIKPEALKELLEKVKEEDAKEDIKKEEFFVGSNSPLDIIKEVANDFANDPKLQNEPIEIAIYSDPVNKVDEGGNTSNFEGIFLAFPEGTKEFNDEIMLKVDKIFDKIVEESKKEASKDDVAKEVVKKETDVVNGIKTTSISGLKVKEDKNKDGKIDSNEVYEIDKIHITKDKEGKKVILASDFALKPYFDMPAKNTVESVWETDLYKFFVKEPPSDCNMAFAPLKADVVKDKLAEAGFMTSMTDVFFTIAIDVNRDSIHALIKAYASGEKPILDISAYVNTSILDEIILKKEEKKEYIKEGETMKAPIGDK